MSERNSFVPDNLGWGSTGDEDYIPQDHQTDQRSEQGAYSEGNGAVHYDGDEAAKRAREQETGMKDES